jgi:hypothetical protein
LQISPKEKARHARIPRHYKYLNDTSILAREIENNFSTPRATSEKIFFANQHHSKLDVSRKSRAFLCRLRQAFPARGKNPFDITASGYRIGDSAARSSCYARQT